MQASCVGNLLQIVMRSTIILPSYTVQSSIHIRTSSSLLCQPLNY